MDQIREQLRNRLLAEQKETIEAMQQAKQSAAPVKLLWALSLLNLLSATLATLKVVPQRLRCKSS